MAGYAAMTAMVALSWPRSTRAAVPSSRRMAASDCSAGGLTSGEGLLGSATDTGGWYSIASSCGAGDAAQTSGTASVTSSCASTEMTCALGEMGGTLAIGASVSGEALPATATDAGVRFSVASSCGACHSASTWGTASAMSSCTSTEMTCALGEMGGTSAIGASVSGEALPATVTDAGVRNSVASSCGACNSASTWGTASAVS